MAMQPHRFRLSIIFAGVCLLLGRAVAREPDPSEQTKNTAPLPLSTATVPNEDFGFMKVVPETAHWKDQEYDIKTGISVLMRVIKNPTTTHDERVLALRYLGNLSIRLQGNKCIDDLVLLYPKLETTDEQYELLFSFISSEDSRALPLVYDVTTGDAQPRLRLRAAAALAQWNIRRGIQALIELFPNEEKGPTRTLGAAALMVFEGYNRRKAWGCPMEEIEAPAKTVAEQDHNAAIELLMRGYRDWFEQNKARFPDWKPGDPLPTSPPFEPDKPSNEKAP